MKNSQHDRISDARMLFSSHGGVLRTKAALDLGIHPETLYRMRDEGTLEALSRGLFRLTDQPDLGFPDLVTVSMRIPHGVVCMISALSFHGITTQTPHAVDIALPRQSRRPQLDYPPVRIYRSVPRIFECGIEGHRVDNRKIRVYSPERTIVDCFRFRNKIGLDTAIEALRLYRERKSINVEAFMDCARTCRAERIIRPYLEGIL
jgi:predicted transcriptional regulator of viral defense system